MKKFKQPFFLLGSFLLHLLMLQNLSAQTNTSPCSKTLLAINAAPVSTLEAADLKTTKRAKKEILTLSTSSVSSASRLIQYQDLEFGQLPIEKVGNYPVLKENCYKKQERTEEDSGKKPEGKQACKKQSPALQKEELKSKKTRRVRPSSTVKLVKNY